MNARHLSGLVLAAAVLSLSACGESPQVQGAHSAAKRDAAPHTGGSAAAFTKDGWKAGDANSWAQQLKTRAQYGMNDHQRVVTP
ncbi:MAG: hypothetical protein C0445_07470 [Polaromonas sp.]|nr:hypothetical protein [Polaromonas sp.]